MSEGKVKFNSSRFGDLEIDTSLVINFPYGLIGFTYSHRFVLLDYNPPFSWLHSVDNPELAFVAVNAAEFGTSYSFDVPYGDKDLDLVQGDDIAIINLVSVRPDPTQTTVNLKAPIIVNLKNMKAKQIVLDDQRFPTRLLLWAPKED
ncbi:MAG: flagellar assembly protein FliW [Deltaproteobacteria bacterium]|nr:flagellar assembly protein FliW [Deltaproteobacteria bacterium]